MCPPAASPLANIGFDCTERELFMLLEKITRGFPLPSNVINDVNPRCYAPSNLPEDVWYLIPSGKNEDTKLGFWRAKGDPCELFSNAVISGWRTTLEYFEGQVPYEHKTDWVMQEYWITQKGLGESSKAKEASLLCRVFLTDERSIVNEEQQQMASPHIASETRSNSTRSLLPKGHNDIGNSSERNTEVHKDDETRRLAVAGTPLNNQMENAPDLGYLNEGDYLELYDLELPASPSSSSDDSSCLTMSSDEYFDSLALLRDLESESNKELVQKNDDCKFSVSASLRPDELVMLPASPGSFMSIEESRPAAQKILITEPSVSDLAEGCENLDRRVSSSNDKGASSSRHMASREEEKKADKGRKKLLKMYLCFMPF